MTVGLFIPCYVDQFYPSVGRATLSVLEKLGFDVGYPPDQTCCGQPLANSGYARETTAINELFVRNFSGFDAVVCPSGSCVLHAKEHIATASVADDEESVEVYSSPCSMPEEYLRVDVAQTPTAGAGGVLRRDAIWEFSRFVGRHLDERLVGRELRSYPYMVGVHQSCHGLRGLRLGTASELMLPASSVVHDLLGRIPGLKFAELDRVDECCGFGGTFAVKEEAVSVRMGEDRIADHERGGAQVVTSADMSCLMHLEGIARRQGQKLVFKHVAEIFDEVL